MGSPRAAAEPLTLPLPHSLSPLSHLSCSRTSLKYVRGRKQAASLSSKGSEVELSAVTPQDLPDFGLRNDVEETVVARRLQRQYRRVPFGAELKASWDQSGTYRSMHPCLGVCFRGTPCFGGWYTPLTDGGADTQRASIDRLCRIGRRAAVLVP
jgi:hypothetical protein